MFLDNLFRATKSALYEIADGANYLSNIKRNAAKYRIPIFRMIVSYIAKSNKNIINEYSDCILASKKGSVISGEVKKLIGNRVSGIQGIFVDLWYDKENQDWKDAMDTSPIKTAMSKLKLSAIDPFEDINWIDDEIISRNEEEDNPDEE